jgi:hypothetical protein
VNPDDVLAVLTAKPFLPFDVELTGGGTCRVTDAQAASLSPTREALLITEPSGARHVLAVRHIIRLSCDALPR